MRKITLKNGNTVLRAAKGMVLLYKPTQKTAREWSICDKFNKSDFEEVKEEAEK